jgi:nicotinate-nucleotide pyrophosphorylase (carboxylating)
MKERLLLILNEDLSKGDVTTALVAEEMARARLVLRENSFLAGLEEAIFLFSQKNVKVLRSVEEGGVHEEGTEILFLEGKNKDILEVERTALNVLSRMSGVARQCFKAREILEGSQTLPALTRKTSPGFNDFDKKAAELAGIWPHRKNLNEMVLLKENHLLYFKSPREAIEKAREAYAGRIKVDVEVENLKQALEAAKAKPDIIMLDNFSVHEAVEAVKALKAKFKGKIELSGGINLDNLKDFKPAEADYISMGCLTNNAKGVDLSLLMEKVKA